MPITHRKVPETPAPINPPRSFISGSRSRTVVAASAIPTASASTIVECPSEKKKPMPSGRLPRCSMKRTVSSIAAMWSASNAWRRPNMYATKPSPTSAG